MGLPRTQPSICDRIGSLADMPGHKVVATNRKARYNYEILDSFEVGIVLLGSEVKSLRDAQIQLKDSYASIRGGEVWLENAHIAPYQFAEGGGHDPERPRKLLLKRREISRFFGRSQAKGYTVVPLKLYLKGNRIKVEIGLAQGKKLYDKRQAARERDLDREAQEAMKGASRYD